MASAAPTGGAVPGEPPEHPSAGPSDAGPFDAEGLRAAFRRAVTSVWVVTAAADGVPAGFTAGSVVSVSLDPPLLSFNLARTASSAPVLLAAGRCAVHLLAEDQEDVARRFAGPSAARFAGDGWRWGADGLPELPGAAARLSGRTTAFVPAGDSWVVLADVRTTEVSGAAPLLHHDRRYTAPAPQRPGAASARPGGATLRACS